MDFTPGYSYNRFFRCKLFLRCLIKGDFINIVRYGICRRREWGMKDLQWILDTAASAYEKRFMKKTRIFVDIALIQKSNQIDFTKYADAIIKKRGQIKWEKDVS